MKSVQRTCGPPAIGSVGGCVGMGGQDIADVGVSSLQVFRFNVNCDDFLSGEMERLGGLAQSLSPTDEVEVHGFASEEGPEGFNEDLSCARAQIARSVLLAAGVRETQIKTIYKHGAVRGERFDRRSVVVSVTNWRRPSTREEQDLLVRLEQLASDAISEAAGAPEGKSFGKAIREFKTILNQRLELVRKGEPLPDDVRFVLEALMLWSKDPGNQWGEGVWDSKDLVMSAADYATVPASQFKCNAYVAEVAYRGVGVIQKAHASQGQAGRYFPFQAKEWGNPSVSIPHFNVVTTAQMGDIWSNGSHTGIYLGTYNGQPLYISARDDGAGVWGLSSQVQQKHGIQIKVLQPGGVYRRYSR